MADSEIPTHAKAAVYDKPGSVSTKVVMVEVPEPGPDEVLVNLCVCCNYIKSGRESAF